LTQKYTFVNYYQHFTGIFDTLRQQYCLAPPRKNF
jgi:hypothetical protein